MENKIENSKDSAMHKLITKLDCDNRLEGQKAREAMLANKQTPFFKDYREKGIPGSEVPSEVVDPLVVKVMNTPQEMLLNFSDVFDSDLHGASHSFNSFVCEECGEMTVESYGRTKDGKHICIDCAAKKKLIMAVLNYSCFLSIIFRTAIKIRVIQHFYIYLIFSVNH